MSVFCDDWPFTAAGGRVVLPPQRAAARAAPCFDAPAPVSYLIPAFRSRQVRSRQCGRWGPGHGYPAGRRAV